MYKKIKFNKPITFSDKTFDESKKYWLSLKLDGERFLLYTSTGKRNFLVSSKGQKVSVPETLNSNLDLKLGLVLDGELYKGVYYAFDILFYDSTDVRGLILEDRVKLLKSVIKTCKGKGLVYKQYYKKDICKDFFALVKKYKFTGKYDGIIFTPNSDYYSTVLKWKPDATIDFKIKKKDGLFLLLDYDNKRFRNKYTNGVLKVSKKEYEKYPDNSVLELSFDPKTFKFSILRQRKDKSKSNYKTVIASNFEQIMNPTDVRKLICE